MREKSTLRLSFFRFFPYQDAILFALSNAILIIFTCFYIESNVSIELRKRKQK